jgi:hypothetical protein
MTSPPRWDIDIALKSALFSQIVYSSDQQIMAFCDVRGYTQREIITDAASDTMVLVAFNGAEIIVCARGTRDLRNWLTDCDIIMEPLNIFSAGDKARIHRGFKNCFGAVRQRVRAAMLDYRAQYIRNTVGATTYAMPIRILFCGHSLGAALALVAFGWWRDNFGPGNELLYNYGQPRVGNKQFADWIDKISGRNTVFRFIHPDDPVPRVPYRLGRYQHNKREEVFFDIAGTPLFNPFWYQKLPSDVEGLWIEDKHFLRESAMEIVDKFTGRKSTMKGQYLIPLLEDHQISGYIDTLAGYKKRLAGGSSC